MLALLHYFEAIQRVAPTQRQLEEAKQTFGVIVKGVQAEQKKLVDSEVHLVEIRTKKTSAPFCTRTESNGSVNGSETTVLMLTAGNLLLVRYIET
ncbi:hypothetical protein BBJ28_00010000 [Nothophytophthora sp. Chile5]|nr:hypothetical protein BBJ28_00010000 [Nothophytophthora sp. Chile5]